MNDEIEMCFEFDWFRKIRSFKDGVSFFDFKINLDLFKGDHNPKFEILWVILNYKILEVNIYNKNHYYDEDWKD